MLYLSFTSYNFIDLISTQEKFGNAFKLLNIAFKGPVSLPSVSKRMTVIRSPHVYNKSREQFAYIAHKRLYVLTNYHHIRISSFLSYLELELPTSIHMSYKVVN